MDTAVTILRELWEKRVVVGVIAIVAIAVGALVAYKPAFPPESRMTQVGTAGARLLVDTPASAAVEVAPKGSEGLGERASLLANLMAEGEVKTEIARRAKIDPSNLITVGPAAGDTTQVSQAQLDDPEANILTTRVLTDDAGTQLPIIDVSAQAPDADRAAALANAAVAGLQEYLDSRASNEGVRETRRLRVRPLGAAQGREVSRGPSPIIALGVTIVLFGVLCALLLIGASMARSWRVARDVEGELRDAFGGAWGLTPPDEDSAAADDDAPPRAVVR